ncbi:hypothetical protein LA080_006475 [Diaporthe eres]|nr:hypothetical protein LA080_006475 [Diaporthe eres]
MLPAGVTFPWCKIPSLVQDIILGELAGDCDGGSTQGGEARAAYAAVCSDWQAFFEKISFRKLVLHDGDLDYFEEIVKRRVKSEKTVRRQIRGRQQATAVLASTKSRMPRIQHIWLRAELLNYDCWYCKVPQTPKEVVRNDVEFTKPLWKLLDILSRWERTDANHGQQLTLELSAHSPCDSQHLLKDDVEHKDDYPYRAGIGAQRDYIASHPVEVRRLASTLHEQILSNPTAHDMNNLVLPYELDSNNPMPNLNRSSAARLISALKFDNFKVKFRPEQRRDRLPEVKMVSSFLMRRQYYRMLSVFALRTLVLESLTGLRNLRCERWRPQSDIEWDWELDRTLNPSIFGATILDSTVSSPLETFCLFEDFSITMHGPEGVKRPRPSRIKVLHWAAISAVNIKNIAVSFLSDAKDCLQFPERTLPNLESVALTSQHWLEPTQENTQKLLYLAARAALKMPSLQIMEIWTCRNGHAAIFRYEATGTAHSSAARLTWRCSWDASKKPIAWDGVTAAWRHVAATNALRELSFTEDPLPRGSHRYEKYGAILHQLKLRNLILDPVSVMQVRMGTGAEDEPEVEAWRSSVPDSYWSQR